MLFASCLNSMLQQPGIALKNVREFVPLPAPSLNFLDRTNNIKRLVSPRGLMKFRRLHWEGFKRVGIPLCKRLIVDMNG